jgi:hypothetical protein
MRVCEPIAPSIEPDEIARRASATCASRTLRAGRGKSAGDCRAMTSGFGCGLAGVVAAIGARTVFLGRCACLHQNQAAQEIITGANSQKNPPPLLLFRRT